MDETTTETHSGRGHDRPRSRSAPRAAAVLLALLALPTGAAAQEPGDTLDVEESQEPDLTPGLSLEPDRTVRFTTTEGTYMNVDVSPDGTTLVFDLLGDIYTVPVEGGEATRLTRGMSFDVQPVFSPDGSKIAYISDGTGSDNVWVMNADGSEPEAVTSERNEDVSTPEWAPEGDYVMARRDGDLWLYHVEGGSGVEMSSDLPGRLSGVRFSPDGRYVYFAGGGSTPQIQRLDRTTGDVVTVTGSPYGAWRPAVSPDGRWMVYGSRIDARTALRLRNLETGREEWLAYDLDRDNSERPAMLDYMPRFDFTPDGEALLLATGGTFHRIELDSKADRAIAFTAEVEQELGPFVHFQVPLTDDSVQVRNIRYANTSPDGTRLVFSALSRIWIQELPDGEPRRLAPEQDFGQFQPVFAPDGRSVAYVSWDDDEGGHLWRLPLEGDDGADAGEPERLTEHPAFYVHPVWSPDGSRIALVREDAAASRNVWSRNTGLIVWLEADGGRLSQVVSAPSDNRLSFSEDGGRIMYVSPGERSGGSRAMEFASIRLDGTDRRVLANLRASDGAVIDQVVPSPDGRWLAFSLRDDIYVAALPRTPEPPTIGASSGPGPVNRVTREGGVDVHWEAGTDRLAWSFADSYYRIDVEDALEVESAGEKEEEEEGEGEEEEEEEPAEEPEVAVEEEEAEEPAVEPERIPVDISVPRRTPEGLVALRGGTIIPMDSERTIPDGTVLIRDNRIVEVGTDVAIPDDATVIDVSGRYVMPGLIDMHAHLRPPRDVFVEERWSYMADLGYGVTSTRDVSTSNDSFAYSELVEAGLMMGPRIFTTGRAMTTSNAQINSLEDARRMLRHYKRMGAHVVKQYMQPHRRQRQWVIQAAREEGLNVTNEGGGDFRLNLTQALDGYTGLEHSLPHADIYGDVVRLLAESRMWYTPTLVVSYGGPSATGYFYEDKGLHDDPRLAHYTPHSNLDRRTRRGRWALMEEYHFPDVAAGAEAILEAGGNVAVGGHGEQQGIAVHWELWALQMGGMSNYDALRAVTSMAADGLGMAADLGTLEPGKLADIVVLDADPLDDIRNTEELRWVMKNGELFDARDLSMVWPERRPAPTIKFQDEKPPEELRLSPPSSPW